LFEKPTIDYIIIILALYLWR